MKYLAVLLCCTLAIGTFAQQKKTLLPNGWTLTPAGRSIRLGDLPLNIAVSQDNKYIAVTNNGVGKQSIQLIDTKTQKVLSTSEISKSWLGLKFSADGRHLYASGGNNNRIVKYNVGKDGLSVASSIVLGKKWPEKISPAGLDIDDQARKLYVVTKGDRALYIADLQTNKVISRLQLSAEAYTCRLSPDRNYLYISLWGGEKLLVFDTRSAMITDSITVGRNPNDICVSDNGKYVYVANAVDNSVSVIDAGAHKVIETLNAALYPDAPDGSTTNSVALSKDNKTLFIANADNNCISVFDVSNPGKSRSKGFIPVGWYPTCVRVVGNTLFVANGKGNTSLPNPKGPQPVKKNGESNYKKATGNDQYIGSLFQGSLSIIPVPGEKQLAAWSKQVYRNTPYAKDKELVAKGEPGNPIPMKVGMTSPIQHVFYIIKENRTYDQVLSDLPGGNGDTSLLLFGRKITPNEHALAEQYVLLDNFYVDAEVSADGHNWSMAAYANDFVEKTWPTNYGGRGGTYDFAGNKKIAMPRNGFLWDYAMRSGLSFRDYGEFTDDDGTFYLQQLKKHACLSFTGWDLAVRDVEREKAWEKDFDSLVAINAVPRLSVIYFPSDHTAGLSKKYRTPNAYVADNDQAVGRLVEHLSQSPAWKNSAVFILEDDAQNGPDHIDAHRSIAFVAGPFVKKNYIDHTMYSTSGMLRTIELILGLPPMSQYDAAAMPMYKCFTQNAGNVAYRCRPAGVDLEEMNVASGLSMQSDQFDFSRPDNVPDMELNRLLWSSLKSYVACPAPRRAAFVTLHQSKENDDD